MRKVKRSFKTNNKMNERSFYCFLVFWQAKNIKKVRLFLTALLNSELHSNHYATRH